MYNLSRTHFLLMLNVMLTLFAVSAVTKGEQMVPILQALGVHCAVFGNHDFGNYTEIFHFFQQPLKRCSFTI